jgi:hypothetical protein
MSVATTSALACAGAGAAIGILTAIFSSFVPHRAGSVQGNDLCADAFRRATPRAASLRPWGTIDWHRQ